jgi:hypothetical protein
MARRCLACLHARVAELNARLRAPQRPMIITLAEEFGLHRDAIARHLAHHLSGAEPVAAGASEPAVVAEEVVAADDIASDADQEEEPVDERVHPNRRVRAGKRTLRTPAKQRFLEAYAQSGNLSQSARSAGVSRDTIYTWQETDTKFVVAFNQAEIEAVEALEAEARERATRGGRLVREVYRGGRLIERVVEYRPSDAVLVKLLQALRPEKYGDKLTLTQTNIVKSVATEAWESI